MSIFGAWRSAGTGPLKRPLLELLRRSGKRKVPCQVFFDGAIPLFKDEKSLSARFLQNSLKYIEPDQAQADIKIVAEFIVHLLGYLNPESRKMIETVMYDQEPGWRSDMNRIDLLFPPHVAEFFLEEA